MRNFNEVFRKDGTYDNIKSHKKSQGSSPSLQKIYFWKNRRAKGDTSRVKPLIDSYVYITSLLYCQMIVIENNIILMNYVSCNLMMT